MFKSESEQRERDVRALVISSLDAGQRRDQIEERLSDQFARHEIRAAMIHAADIGKLPTNWEYYR